MKNPIKLTFKNNFDLLRLIAALEVIFYHIFTHFKPPKNPEWYNFIFNNFIHYFQGVPIFFMISGFLIYWSFERNANSVRKYFQNRARRIFPALWVCTLITLLVLFIFGGISSGTFLIPKLVLWIIGQLSFLQFWTPDVFRTFGLGNPNGALYTITIELQFYLLVPMLFFQIKSKSILSKNKFLILIALISYIFNQIAFRYLNHQGVLFKLVEVSVFPYLFYFIVGILFFINFEKLEKYISSKFHIWFLIFISYCLIFSSGLKLFSPSYWPNIFGLVFVFLLTFTVFSFAFSFRGLSEKLLNKNDFSYGIYIYHGFLLNLFVGIGINKQEYVPIFCLLVFILGTLSWFFIEKNFIRKTNPSY